MIRTRLVPLTCLAILLALGESVRAVDSIRGVGGSRVADDWGGKPAGNGDTDAPMYLDPYMAPRPIIKPFTRGSSGFG